MFQSNHVNGGGSSNSGLDAPQSGHGRDLNGLAGGRIQDTVSSNGLRISGSEALKQSLNFSRGAQEQGLDASRQTPSPQWLKEIVSQKQRIPSVQGPNLFSSNSDQQRNESSVPDVGSGVPSQSQSAPPPSGRIRVFCPNYGMSLSEYLTFLEIVWFCLDLFSDTVVVTCYQGEALDTHVDIIIHCMCRFCRYLGTLPHIYHLVYRVCK